jgi:hypothetical protein
MRRVYRPTRIGRVLFGLLSAAFALFGLVGVAVASFSDEASGERIGILFPAALFVALGCLMLFSLRVRIVADDRGVEVVNYASRHRFRWEEIDRFEVGFAYFGITVVPKQGPPIKANAVQKSNLYHWLRQQGRADRIVEELTGLLVERSVPSILPPPPP